VLVVVLAGTVGTIFCCILGARALLVHNKPTALSALHWKNGRQILRHVNRREHLVATTLTEGERWSQGETAGVYETALLKVWTLVAISGVSRQRFGS
jgi:hypothetical protein